MFESCSSHVWVVFEWFESFRLSPKDSLVHSPQINQFAVHFRSRVRCPCGWLPSRRKTSDCHVCAHHAECWAHGFQECIVPPSDTTCSVTELILLCSGWWKCYKYIILIYIISLLQINSRHFWVNMRFLLESPRADGKTWPALPSCIRCRTSRTTPGESGPRSIRSLENRTAQNSKDYKLINRSKEFWVRLGAVLGVAKLLRWRPWSQAWRPLG